MLMLYRKKAEKKIPSIYWILPFAKVRSTSKSDVSVCRSMSVCMQGTSTQQGLGFVWYRTVLSLHTQPGSVAFLLCTSAAALLNQD